MEARRSARIVEALREELEELITYEMTDPRVSGVTVTDITLSPDGKKAQIRVHIPLEGTERAAALEALQNARGFLKYQLGVRVTMFRMPELRFEPDVGPDLEARMASLLKRVKRGRPKEELPEPEKP